MKYTIHNHVVSVRPRVPVPCKQLASLSPTHNVCNRLLAIATFVFLPPEGAKAATTGRLCLYIRRVTFTFLY